LEWVDDLPKHVGFRPPSLAQWSNDRMLDICDCKVVCLTRSRDTTKWLVPVWVTVCEQLNHPGT